MFSFRFSNKRFTVNFQLISILSWFRASYISSHLRRRLCRILAVFRGKFGKKIVIIFVIVIILCALLRLVFLPVLRRSQVLQLFLRIVSRHQVNQSGDGSKLIHVFLGSEFDHLPVCSFDVYFILTNVVSFNLARSWCRNLLLPCLTPFYSCSS